MDVGLVMGHAEVALDQIAIVLRIEDSLFDVVAGESTHILERLEQEDCLELCPVAVGVSQDERPARSADLARVPVVSSVAGFQRSRPHYQYRLGGILSCVSPGGRVLRR